MMKKSKRKSQTKFETIIYTIIVMLLLQVSIDICRFPECHLTTWRYQLKNELLAGDANAIEYYNKHYISKGKLLYNNNSINKIMAEYAGR